jgi:hypothetical protein
MRPGAKPGHASWPFIRRVGPGRADKVQHHKRDQQCQTCSSQTEHTNRPGRRGPRPRQQAPSRVYKSSDGSATGGSSRPSRPAPQCLIKSWVALRSPGNAPAISFCLLSSPTRPAPSHDTCRNSNAICRYLLVFVLIDRNGSAF